MRRGHSQKQRTEHRKNVFLRDDALPRFGRMDAVGLIERGIECDTLKKKRCERERILARKIGVDRIELLCIRIPEIPLRLHADQEHDDLFCLKRRDDPRKLSARDCGRDAAEHVIPPKRQDHDIGIGYERKIYAARSGGRSIARHAHINDRDVESLRCECMLKERGICGIKR